MKANSLFLPALALVALQSCELSLTGKPEKHKAATPADSEVIAETEDLPGQVGLTLPKSAPEMTVEEKCGHAGNALDILIARSQRCDTDAQCTMVGPGYAPYSRSDFNHEISPSGRCGLEVMLGHGNARYIDRHQAVYASLMTALRNTCAMVPQPMCLPPASIGVALSPPVCRQNICVASTVPFGDWEGTSEGAKAVKLAVRSDGARLFVSASDNDRQDLAVTDRAIRLDEFDNFKVITEAPGAEPMPGNAGTVIEGQLDRAAGKMKIRFWNSSTPPDSADTATLRPTLGAD
jgi:hypothetical protein